MRPCATAVGARNAERIAAQPLATACEGRGATVRDATADKHAGMKGTGVVSVLTFTEEHGAAAGRSAHQLVD